MRVFLGILLIASLGLASCGGWSNSRVNPRNWGASRDVPVKTNPNNANPLIPSRGAKGLLRRPDAEDVSQLIANVTEMRVESTPSGAIIHARGIAARQGAYAAQLRPADAGEKADDSTLSFEFRVNYPEKGTVVGGEASRVVHVAYTVGRQDLDGIRIVRITGAQNARESRRR